VDPLIQARGLSLNYGSKTALTGLSFTVPKGRVVGLLGHNGAGKTSLMKALVGLHAVAGELSVLGLQPRRQRVELLQSLAYIPDVAVLPRWARVSQLIELMSGLHPRFSAERARALLRRTGVGLGDKVKNLSKGMVVQVHLALVAAIDARLMILDEPTLGLDLISRKAFYEMLLDEWCDGERSVLISTHQVEEIETLLSDVLMLNEGQLVLSRYRAPGMAGGAAALFDGAPPADVMALGQRLRPSLVDLFMALTRQPGINRTSPP
jgi:ABC-2 type transport system ATP-binding protein